MRPLAAAGRMEFAFSDDSLNIFLKITTLGFRHSQSNGRSRE
jgi:hypothetical protein